MSTPPRAEAGSGSSPASPAAGSPPPCPSRPRLFPPPLRRRGPRTAAASPFPPAPDRDTIPIACGPAVQFNPFHPAGLPCGRGPVLFGARRIKAYSLGGVEDLVADKSEKRRLAERAERLKKAFLLAACMAGVRLTAEQSVLPAYRSWDKRPLRIHCADLEADVVNLMARLVVSPKQAIRPAPLRWLVEQFDRWFESGLGLFTICTAQQFEARVGHLVAHRVLEIPPYAEILLQPGIDVAFRHPEYMLVRDLGALYDLYRDAESLCGSVRWDDPPGWAGAASENSQSLARAVVQACFNLLESFVSGLARAHVLTCPSPDAQSAEKLLSTREPLKHRIRRVPALITGRECPLDPNKYPLEPLFGEIKRRRDAFVHCEPGPLESERGYVKEAVFHEVSPEVVGLAIRATHDAIRQVWEFTRGRPGPRWLPVIGEEGRFGRENLRLVPRTPDAA